MPCCIRELMIPASINLQDKKNDIIKKEKDLLINNDLLTMESRF